MLSIPSFPAMIPGRKTIICGLFLLALCGSPLFGGPHPQPVAPAAKVDPAVVLKACFRDPVTVNDMEYAYNDKKYKIGIVNLKASDKVAGYIFDSEQFAPNVEGYGGTFNLLVVVDESGKLLDFAVKLHHETPKYLQKVMARKKEMLGKNIFTGATGFKGDAVSGATYTSKGLAEILNTSGRLCAAVLQKNVAENQSGEKTVAPPPGKSRDINAKAYQQQIDAKQLSSQPARYWHAEE